MQPRGSTQGGSSLPIYDDRHNSEGTKLLRKIPASVRLIHVQFSERNAQVEAYRWGVADLSLGVRGEHHNLTELPGGGMTLVHSKAVLIRARCTHGVVVLNGSKGGVERAARRRK